MHIEYLVNVTYIFQNGSHFAFFFICLFSPTQLRFRAFITGTVMHLFWATYTEGILHLWQIFLKWLPFCAILN